MDTHPPAGGAPSLAEVLWHRGHVGLQAALAAALALTLGAAWWAPEYVWLLPLVLAGMGVWLWMFCHPDVYLVTVLAGFAFVARTADGIQISELLYGAYYASYLAHWYGTRLLAGERFIRGFTDRVVALLIVFGLGLGVFLGLLFGATLGDILGEALGFGMVTFYFPVKELCRRRAWGAAAVAVMTAWVGLFVSFTHFLNYREIVLSAVQAWQVADARPGYNALQLMVPIIGCFALLVSLRSRWQRLVVLGVLLICTLALALIKYRAFWVGAAFGLGILFLLLPGRRRWKLILLLAVGGGTGVGFAFLFLGDAAILFLTGLINRFSTLGTAFEKDLSLINRLVESRALWELIEVNPVLGYGFGTRYSYYSLIFEGTSVRSHVHNGYVGLWYKLGAWGMVLGFSYLLGAARCGFKVYRSSRVPSLERTLALAGTASLLALAPTIASETPFFFRDQMYTIAVVAGLCCGLYQRYRLASLSEAQPPGS